MKTVILKYPGSKQKLKKKFKVAASTKGSVFRGYIARDLPQFYDTEYFLLFEKKDQPLILDESKTFGSLSEDKKIFLHLVFSKVNISVKSSDNKSRYMSMCLKESVIQNIEDAKNIKNPQLYTFAFKPTNDPSFYRVVCKSMPLVYQEWFGEQLHLVRRVLPAEIDDIEELYRECVFSADLGLTIMKTKEWIEAAICRLIIEDHDPATISKKDLMSVIPNNIRVDEQLFSFANSYIADNGFMLQKKAMKRYVQISTQNGGQCCFIDKIQFLIVDGKWRMSSTRFLYVSPMFLIITKELGTSVKYKIPLNSIREYHVEDEFIIISFKNHQHKWRVKSIKNKQILKCVLDDLTEISKNDTNNKTPRIVSEKPKDHSPLKAMPIEESSDSNDDTIFISNYNVVKTKETNNSSNGLSQIIIPRPEEKNSPFDISPHVSRDLSCVKMVKIPEEKVENEEESEDEDSLKDKKSIVNSIPLLNKLNISPLAKEFILVCILFFIFFVAKDILS